MNTFRTTMNNVHSIGEPWSVTLSSNALSLGLSAFDSYRALASQTLELPSIPKEWMESEYREAAVEAEVANGIAWQIRINREERGWTQKELAGHLGTKQSAVSKLEDPDGGDLRVSTLTKVAHAFGCALLVRFVSHSTMLAFTQDARSERLCVPSFADECHSLGVRVGSTRNVLNFEANDVKEA